MNALHFRSLAEFVEGTKSMTRDEAYQTAKAEFAILSEWKDATPAAQKYHRPPEVERFVDYFADLKKLLFHCENGFSTARGYKQELIERALERWRQNAKPNSTGDVSNGK